GIFERAFTELRKIAQTRHNTIGGHAVELRGAARDAIKFLNGQLQRAVFIGMTAQQRGKPANRKDRLHSAFTERVFVADDDRTAIVLKRSDKSLARRRALPTGRPNH